MSGMWKRSHGRTSEAPPDERGGYRYVRPTATAPHLDSTRLAHSRASRRGRLIEPIPAIQPTRRKRAVLGPLQTLRGDCLEIGGARAEGGILGPVFPLG